MNTKQRTTLSITSCWLLVLVGVWYLDSVNSGPGIDVPEFLWLLLFVSLSAAIAVGLFCLFRNPEQEMPPRKMIHKRRGGNLSQSN